jgi:hypothetical protein
MCSGRVGSSSSKRLSVCMYRQVWGEVVKNTVVSNHFHSVKNFLFSSAKPHDFDGMLGTGLPLSMYTAKTPIDISAVLTFLNLKNVLHFL